jgi:hypothetical protein
VSFTSHRSPSSSLLGYDNSLRPKVDLVIFTKKLTISVTWQDSNPEPLEPDIAIILPTNIMRWHRKMKRMLWSKVLFEKLAIQEITHLLWSPKFHYRESLSSSLFPSRFPTKILYEFIILSACYMSHPSILIDLMTLICFSASHSGRAV